MADQAQTKLTSVHDEMRAWIASRTADPLDPRLQDRLRLQAHDLSLAEIVRAATTADKQSARSFALIGYPDDEGIRLNGGRPGASEAPTRIRRSLYRMTPSPYVTSDWSLWDVGNVATAKLALNARHETANHFVGGLLKAGFRTVSLGGGHDYGFADASAYAAWAGSQGHRPLIINFDAHLDVRPLDRGLTSGTPFYRLLTAHPNCDFLELGLQSQCNSRHHVEWLRAHGGRLMFEEERHAEGLSLTAALHRLLSDSTLTTRSAFLSIDIDGFSSSVAPGASQSWPTGFLPDDFFPALAWCLGRLDVRGIGIYEVSPPLDLDDRTSRLAALIAHRFMFQSAP